MAIRKASELKTGDVVIGLKAGPLVVRRAPMPARYRGKQDGHRLHLGDGQRTFIKTWVVAGDPVMHIADNPEDAWNEHVQIRDKL